MWKANTTAEIDGDTWLINGRPTYTGRSYRNIKVEGLLLNSRMANAVFDDDNPLTRHLWSYPDTNSWDAKRNTAELVKMLPLYASHGLTAININIQGGSPLGYYRDNPVVLGELRTRIHSKYPDATDEDIWLGLSSVKLQPWKSSGFDGDGVLGPGTRERMASVIESADTAGLLVCLGLFYFGQDNRLSDENAVRRAVREVCSWILLQGYRNVIIEINNETDVPRYSHAILRPNRVHELISYACSIHHGGYRLLVGTSFTRREVPSVQVVDASDFILLHGNGIDEPEKLKQMVRSVRSVASYRGQPVLFNEDDHFDFNDSSNNFVAALETGSGWGYFDPGFGAGGKMFYGDYENGYQNPPINWSINTSRKKEFFELLQKITGFSI